MLESSSQNMRSVNLFNRLFASTSSSEVDISGNGRSLTVVSLLPQSNTMPSRGNPFCYYCVGSCEQCKSKYSGLGSFAYSNAGAGITAYVVSLAADNVVTRHMLASNTKTTTVMQKGTFLLMIALVYIAAHPLCILLLLLSEGDQFLFTSSVGVSFVPEHGDEISGTGPLFITTVQDPVGNWATEGLAGMVFVMPHPRQNTAYVYVKALDAASTVNVYKWYSTTKHSNGKNIDLAARQTKRLSLSGGSSLTYVPLLQAPSTVQSFASSYRIVSTSPIVVYTKTSGNADARQIPPGAVPCQLLC